MSIAALVVGCSSSSEAPPPDGFEQFKQHIDGQVIAIVPFDLDDAACQEDPAAMAPETLGRCARLDDTSAGYSITDDPRTFDPTPTRRQMLVVHGATIDPARAGWVGILGLGPIPKNAGPLLAGQGIRPQFLPLVIAGGALLQVAIEGAILYYGAKAIIATVKALNHDEQEQVTTTTTTLVEGQSQLTCTPERHAELKEKKNDACNTLSNNCIEYARTNRFSFSYCLGLELRRQQRKDCLDIRKQVTAECFGGVRDARHEGAEVDVERQFDECDALLDADCPGIKKP